MGCFASKEQEEPVRKKLVIGEASWNHTAHGEAGDEPPVANEEDADDALTPLATED